MAAGPLSKRVWTVDLNEEELDPRNTIEPEWYDQEDQPFLYETAFKANDRLLIVYKGSTYRLIVSRVEVDLNAQYYDDTLVQYTLATIAYLKGIPLDQTIQSVSTGTLPDSLDAWVFSTERDGYVVFNDKALSKSKLVDGSVYGFVELQAVFLDTLTGRGPDWGVPQDIYYRTNGDPAVFYCGYRQGYITLGKADPLSGQTIWVEWTKASQIIDDFDGQVACAFKKPLAVGDPPALVVFMIESASGDLDDGVLRILQFDLSEDSFKGWGPLVDDYGKLDYFALGEITGGDVTGGALQAGFFDSTETGYLYQYGDDTVYLLNVPDANNRRVMDDEDVLPVLVPKFSSVFPNLNQSGRYQVVFNNDNQGLTIVTKQRFKSARLSAFEGFTIESVMYDSKADTVYLIRPDDIDYE
jgi:hypothetical protein